MFCEVLDAIPFEIVNPSVTEVQEAARYTTAKDAPIVAAARSAHAHPIAGPEPHQSTTLDHGPTRPV